MSVRNAGRRFFPLDEQMKVRETHWSEQVAKLASWLSGIVTFEQAQEIMEKVGQIGISGSSIWRQAQRWGGKYQAIETLYEKKAQGIEGELEINPGRSLGRRGVAMDGGMVHIREEGWKELKVGCVFEIEMRKGYDEHSQAEVELGHAVKNAYVAHLGGPEAFGWKMWAKAHQRGWLYAQDTISIGDGAVWIWNLVSKHFYDSRRLVDWYHATQHLANAVRLLYGEDTPQAHRWYREWSTQLYLGHADRLTRILVQKAKEHPKLSKELLKESGYFRNNQHRMDYLEMRSEGYPIGSGMVESAAKQYKSRFVGPGMRWKRTSFEHLLPIRTSIMSGNFDKMWRLAYSSPPN